MTDIAHNSFRSGCPINIALELLGDGWSLLIVRDLMFKGRNTFHAFLQAEEGIATNILTDRLHKLEGNGILTKRRNPEDARRFIYALTQKGIALAPVLAELILWSATYEQTDAPPEVISFMREDRKAFLDQAQQAWLSKRADGAD